MQYLKLLVGVILFAPSTMNAQDVRTETVRFAAGETGASVEGSITGYEGVDYVLGAAEGQEMTVDLHTDHGSAYFNVIAPGADAAMFIGSTSGKTFRGTLPSTGDYTVRVYLMRNAARRGETAEYRIDFGIDSGGDAAEPMANDYADGMAGGPDFWAVQVASDDSLNVRSGAGTGQAIVGVLYDGDVVRNLGCSMQVGSRWCRVRSMTGRGGAEGPLEGWVSGRFLVESAGPDRATGSGRVISEARGDTPGLYVRGTGEIEVSFADSPCGILHDADGRFVTAGAVCSDDQLRRAADAATAFVEGD